MTFDLLSALPMLVPKAIAWAEEQQAMIVKSGQPLDEALRSLAASVGVRQPESIRVCVVARLPLPEDPSLRDAAQAAGLLGPNMVGLTLGYGVYICQGHVNVRLLSHEFRHVHQYEQAGSISTFLPEYLRQIATVGYQNAPYELDALAHERLHPG